MMLGPEKRAIVCRGSGEMVEKVEKVTPLKAKSPVLGLPLIRGVAAFISSMVNGVKALSFSADQLPEDMQEEPDKIDLWIEKHFSNETAQKLIIGVAVVLGIALSLFLFCSFRRLLSACSRPLKPIFIGGLCLRAYSSLSFSLYI